MRFIGRLKLTNFSVGIILKLAVFGFIGLLCDLMSFECL
jgi:hypothetical protein